MNIFQWIVCVFILGLLPLGMLLQIKDNDHKGWTGAIVTLIQIILIISYILGYLVK